MKAVIITAFGDPDVLKIQERPRPKIAADEVLIKVNATGVNRPDIFQRKGKYPAPAGVPADIPGLEVAGMVEKAGKSVTNFKPGDKVFALLAGSGYAGYAKAPEGQVLPIPEGFSFEEAAGLAETLYTVYHNVFQRAQLQPGEGLLIHGGSSGIGIMAIQLAKATGATVYVTVGSDEKGKKCLELGADQFVNYKKEDFAATLKGKKIDVILDMIGGGYFEKNIDVLNQEGRLVYINAMNGHLVTLNILQMMQKRISILGSTLRSRDKAFKAALTKEIKQQMLPLLAKGHFTPVIHRIFSLSDASEAHRLMESNQHIGKIILRVD